MTNRVALGLLPGGGYGVRVSRPGYDVLNNALTGAQIAFDSRWVTAARVFLNGSVTAPQSSFGSYTSIAFPSSLPSIPTAIVMQRQSSSSQWVSVDSAAFDESWQPTGGLYEAARVFTNRIEFLNPTFGGSRVYSYLIMRPL